MSGCATSPDCPTRTPARADAKRQQLTSLWPALSYECRVRAGSDFPAKLIAQGRTMVSVSGPLRCVNEVITGLKTAKTSAW
jgi:hypothetical protein